MLEYGIELFLVRSSCRYSAALPFIRCGLVHELLCHVDPDPTHRGLDYTEGSFFGTCLYNQQCMTSSAVAPS